MASFHPEIRNFRGSFDQIAMFLLLLVSYSTKPTYDAICIVKSMILNTEDATARVWTKTRCSRMNETCDLKL